MEWGEGKEGEWGEGRKLLKQIINSFLYWI